MTPRSADPPLTPGTDPYKIEKYKEKVQLTIKGTDSSSFGFINWVDNVNWPP